MHGAPGARPQCGSMQCKAVRVVEVDRVGVPLDTMSVGDVEHRPLRREGRLVVHVVARLDRVPVVEGVGSRGVEVRGRPAGDIEHKKSVVDWAEMVRRAARQVLDGP